jgi:type I restriction enzyme, S subunit
MEMKPGYKLTEVGVIPVEWEVKPLSEAVDFLDGRRRPVKDSDRAKMRGDIPYYGASGIVDYVNDFLFNEDLILLGEDGENILSRNCRLAFKISGKTWVNNHAHVLRPKPGMVLEFLVEFLESRDYAQYNTGTAQPKLNKLVCSRIPVLRPPPPEQRAIAEALSDVDGLLGGLDRLIAKKRDLKQAAMQQLLTGQTRLPGFHGEWEVKRLGSVGTFLKGSGVKKDEAMSGDLPCVRYGEIYTLHHDVVRAFNSFLSASVAAVATPLRKGDLLFAGSGETKEEIGKAVAFVHDCEAYAGGDIVILRPEASNAVFLGYYLNSRAIQKQKASRGQGDAVVHISAASLAAIEVMLPSIPEQTAIAGVLTEMDGELAVLEQRREKTRALKQAMMQELLTGRTRLV